MEEKKDIFVPVIDNAQIEKLNLALKQIMREVAQKEANVIVTNIEGCLLYSLEVMGIDPDLNKIDILCESLTTKILGVNSKKCFTNIIGKKKEGVDILSFREICLNIE